MLVLAAPGTAVFFDQRLWHMASPWSNATRKVLFVATVVVATVPTL
jgi:ectoine hydroxylase-related dioxygenase (phytanoyl-CoA dioxygenase family)